MESEIEEWSLANPRVYLGRVALDVCQDYFGVLRAHSELDRSLTWPERYKEARHMFNAAVALDNAPEYVFHFGRPEDARDPASLGRFKGALRAQYPELGEIEAIANAYKHAFRWQRKGKQPFGADKLAAEQVEAFAWDLDGQSAQLDGEVAIGTATTLSLMDGREHIEAGFRFWIKYLNRQLEIDVDTVLASAR